MSQINELANEEVEMEMTPMIDVTFLLLIFFMCTLKFKTLEGKLSAYLPKDVGVNSSTAPPIEKVEILVRVREAGAKLKPNKSGLYVEPAPGTPAKRYVWNREDAAYPLRKLEYTVMNKMTREVGTLETDLKRIYDARKKLNSEDKVPATIDARPGTCYGDVVPVLDAAINAGFRDITFVGAYPDHIK